MQGAAGQTEKTGCLSFHHASLEQAQLDNRGTTDSTKKETESWEEKGLDWHAHNMRRRMPHP